MIFTDDDLKDWKDRLDPAGSLAVVSLPIEKQRALLARLEMAEWAINVRNVRGVFEIAFERWRKAADK